jgi:hypothetical protein
VSTIYLLLSRLPAHSPCHFHNFRRKEALAEESSKFVEGRAAVDGYRR